MGALTKLPSSPASGLIVRIKSDYSRASDMALNTTVIDMRSFIRREYNRSTLDLKLTKSF